MRPSERAPQTHTLLQQCDSFKHNVTRSNGCRKGGGQSTLRDQGTCIFLVPSPSPSGALLVRHVFKMFALPPPFRKFDPIANLYPGSAGGVPLTDSNRNEARRVRRRRRAGQRREARRELGVLRGVHARVICAPRRRVVPGLRHVFWFATRVGSHLYEWI